LPRSVHWVQRLNELRMVRATLAWENYVEATLACYLRGSVSVTGRRYALAVQPAKNLADAQTLALGGAPFGQWLNEHWAHSRIQTVFVKDNPYGILTSATLADIRKVRNRIVHRSEKAAADFQYVAVSAHGAARPGLTPGRFLSERGHSSPRVVEYLDYLLKAASTIAS
jgi:hypothetical protein